MWRHGEVLGFGLLAAGDRAMKRLYALRMASGFPGNGPRVPDMVVFRGRGSTTGKKHHAGGKSAGQHTKRALSLHKGFLQIRFI